MEATLRVHARFSCLRLQSARKRPTAADLLDHPWILKHCPRTPVPAAAEGLNEVASEKSAVSDSKESDDVKKVSCSSGMVRHLQY